MSNIRGRMKNLRDLLIQEDKDNNKKNGKITDGFSQLGSKYKFDVLVEDLNIILWHIKFSLESVKENYSSVSKIVIPYCPGESDNKFWYGVDCGLRSLSCGWDRLGLFLDLSFGGKLGTNCTFYKIVKNIEKKGEYNNNQYFKKLINFRDNNLTFLQGGKGEGYRNESIHSLTLGTRFWFEFIENYNGTITHPLYWHDKIIEHDLLLREGIENTFFFIESINLD